MRNLTKYSLILIVLSWPGCKDNSLVDPAPNGLLPLSVNTYWTYYLEDLDSKGDSLRSWTISEAIPFDSLIDGKKRYRYILGTDFALYGTSFFLTNEDDGVHEYVRPMDTSYLFYKYPGTVNEEFASFRDTIKIIAINERVSTPAGTFNCIVYQQWTNYFNGNNPKNILLTTYVAPGIGKVKYEYTFIDPFHSDDPSPIRRGILVEYRIF